MSHEIQQLLKFESVSRIDLFQITVMYEGGNKHPAHIHAGLIGKLNVLVILAMDKVEGTKSHK